MSKKSQATNKTNLSKIALLSTTKHTNPCPPLFYPNQRVKGSKPDKHSIKHQNKTTVCIIIYSYNRSYRLVKHQQEYSHNMSNPKSYGKADELSANISVFTVFTTQIEKASYPESFISQCSVFPAPIHCTTARLYMLYSEAHHLMLLSASAPYMAQYKPRNCSEKKTSSDEVRIN